MRRQKFAIGLLALTATVGISAQSVAQAQPTLDRVLDRVEQELNRVLPPHDNPADDNPLLHDGDVQPADSEPGYLGILADDRTEQGQGVRITGVLPGTPAATAKLAENDLILAINGRPIRSMDEMARILSSFSAGAEITFTVMREGQPQRIPVVLGNRPGTVTQASVNFAGQPEAVVAVRAERPKLGVRTIPVNAQTRARNQLPIGEGALVSAVTPGSVAERVGLRIGSVITQINGEKVTSPDQLVELLGRAADAGTLQIAFIRDGEIITQNEPFGVATTSVVVGKPATPSAPAAAADNFADDPREIEPNHAALERRLSDLEDRVAQLEAALAEKDRATAEGRTQAELQDEADLDAATDRAAEDE